MTSKPPVPGNEISRRAALQRYDLLDTPAEAAFDTIVSLARDIFDVPIALVSLIDADRQWFKAASGLEACETSRDLAFCAYTILDDQPLVVPDARADLRFAENALVTGEPFIRFYAGAPLRTRDGFKLGSLCIIDRVPRTLDANGIVRLRRLADMVEELIENRLVLRHAQEAERAQSGRDALTSEMLREVSHDLRAPLTAMVSYAEAIAGEAFGPIENARYKDYAATIARSGRELNSMLTDALNARVEDATAGARTPLLDVGQSVSSVAGFFAITFRDRGVGLETQVAEEGLTVAAESEPLRRILMNLISNAMHHTPSGGHVKVTVEPGSDRSSVVIAVIDDGPGIAPERLARIQAGLDVERHAGGKNSVGMGLKIARRLTTMLAGALDIASTPGRGTRATVTLPRATAVPAGVQAAE